MSILNVAVGQNKTIQIAIPNVENSIEGNFSDLKVDQFYNMYVFGQSGQLIKMNRNGNKLAVYNDLKKLANPTNIDVSNPLQILVYYKPMATVVILDQLLTSRNSLDFRKQQLYDVTLVASSYDNKIWLYNGGDFTLSKVDASLNILYRGDDLRAYFSKAPQPVKIFCQTNYVFLYDPMLGLLEFDQYGVYVKTFPLINWTKTQLINNYFIGWLNDECHVFNVLDDTETVYSLPKSFFGFRDALFVNDKLFVLRENRIDVYSSWLTTKR